MARGGSWGREAVDGHLPGIHRKPSTVPFRRDARDCGSEQHVEPGVGVPGPAMAWPPVSEGLASSLKAITSCPSGGVDCINKAKSSEIRYHFC